MPQLRHILMGLALVATFAASVLDWPGQTVAEGDNAADDLVATRKHDSTTATPSQPDKVAPIAATVAAKASAAKADSKATEPAGQRMHHSKANAFAAHSWLPPVVQAKAPPAPPPRAPPLPFVYLGKMQDGAAVTAFVSQGGRNHVLHAGDKLPSYQVESITATDITFVYLPLNEKQRLKFGSEN